MLYSKPSQKSRELFKLFKLSKFDFYDRSRFVWIWPLRNVWLAKIAYFSLARSSCDYLNAKSEFKDMTNDSVSCFK